MKTWENYAQQLKDDFPCQALWFTEEESRLNPGTIGWLDEEGIWRRECHLKDNPDFASLPAPVENKESIWGPRYSRSIESKKGSIAAGARPPHIPAKFTIESSYTSSSSSGALLVTKNMINRKQYDYDNDFERWVYANARVLREDNSQFGTYGFYVVNKTYTTEQCWSTSWRKRAKQGKSSLGATVYEAANVEASREWLVDHGSATWNESPARDGKMTVVAFGGLYFRYCKFRWYHVHRLALKNRRHFYWWDSGKALRAVKMKAPLPIQGNEAVPKEAAEEINGDKLMEMMKKAKQETNHTSQNPDRFFLFADMKLDRFNDSLNEFDYVVEYRLCHVAMDAKYHGPQGLESRTVLTFDGFREPSNIKLSYPTSNSAIAAALGILPKEKWRKNYTMPSLGRNPAPILAASREQTWSYHARHKTLDDNGSGGGYLKAESESESGIRGHGRKRRRGIGIEEEEGRMEASGARREEGREGRRLRSQKRSI